MNNYFGLSDDKVLSNSVQGFLIAENNVCTLEKCEYVVKGGNNLEAIEFTYKMNDNDVIRLQRDTRFGVDEDNIRVKDGETQEEALKKAWGRVNAVLKHVATKFNCTDDEMNALTGANFRQYATNYCNLIMSKVKKDNPTLYCKVYNKGGYAAVGKYPNFLQRTDAGPCTLQYTNEENTANALVKPNGVVADVSHENYV